MRFLSLSYATPVCAFQVMTHVSAHGKGPNLVDMNPALISRRRSTIAKWTSHNLRLTPSVNRWWVAEGTHLAPSFVVHRMSGKNTDNTAATNLGSEWQECNLIQSSGLHRLARKTSGCVLPSLDGRFFVVTSPGKRQICFNSPKTGTYYLLGCCNRNSWDIYNVFRQTDRINPGK